MKWPWRKEKKTRRVNPAVFNRSYVAGETSRLYNWQTGTDRSADGEIKDRLKTIRKRSRELIQNEPLAKNIYHFSILRFWDVMESGFR